MDGFWRRSDMNRKLNRRDLIFGGAIAATGASSLAKPPHAAAWRKPARKMHLGLVTYNVAKDWDLDTILKNCKAAGIEGVEFRTTHAHGVEPSIDAAALQF